MPEFSKSIKLKVLQKFRINFIPLNSPIFWVKLHVSLAKSTNKLLKFSSLRLLNIESLFGSICLIALDRHHIIVNATRTGHSKAISFGYIILVWACAGLCAAPILPNTKLDVVELSQGAVHYVISFLVSTSSIIQNESLLSIILIIGFHTKEFCRKDPGSWMNINRSSL